MTERTFVAEQSVEGIPNFWERVRRASHRLLGLDYDGTLAPFHVMREAAVPVPGVRETLRAIQEQTDTNLVLLSGRPVVEVVGLLGKDTGIPIIGAHGYEVVTPDGTVTALEPSAQQQEGLARAWDLATAAGHEERLEKKIASIALHTREVPNAEEVSTSMQEAWFPLVEAHDLSVLPFNGGVEIRAKGRNKGVAFAAHLSTMPAGTLPVYIGDDTTDEDVFRMLRHVGIGIKVGNMTEDTEATGRLADPSAVQKLLENWRHILAPPSTS